MAARKKITDDVLMMESTGAVATPKAPIETTHETGNESTGAVAQEQLGETRADHWGADVVVTSPTPTEPVTMSVSWLSEASKKVIEAPEQSDAAPSDAEVETKNG